MPKVTGGVAAAIVAVLLLTGCSSAAPSDDAQQKSAPLVAQSASGGSSSDGDANASFLAEVRANLPAKTQIPNATDQQLLDAGKKACERRSAGEASDTISVIDGEKPNVAGYYLDSGVIITAAKRSLCR